MYLLKPKLFNRAKRNRALNFFKIKVTKSTFERSNLTGANLKVDEIFKFRTPKFISRKGKMKKLIALSVLAISIGSSAAVSAEAKSTDSSKSSAVSTLNAVEPQIRVQLGNRNRYRRVRVVNRTRIVRVGFRRYRETVQYRYLPNGRVTTRVISRVRVR